MSRILLAADRILKLIYLYLPTSALTQLFRISVAFVSTKSLCNARHSIAHHMHAKDLNPGLKPAGEFLTWGSREQLRHFRGSNQFISINCVNKRTFLQKAMYPLLPQ